MKYLLIFISSICFSQDFSPSYMGMSSKITSDADKLNDNFYFNGFQFRALEQFKQVEFGMSVNFYTQDKQTINAYGLGTDVRYLFGKSLVQPFVGLGVNYQKYKFYGSYFPAISNEYLGNINYLSVAPSIGMRYLILQDEISGLELFCMASRNLILSKSCSDNFNNTSINNQIVFNAGFIFTAYR